MERRLAAILAADIVGYSKLVGQDEIGALAMLKDLRSVTLRPLTAQHRGRIIKSMGDGWLISFDTARDAVSFAIKFQDALENYDAIKLRIGVHLGDITSDEEDVFGDLPAVASA